ncbi:MAG TPA: TolC family protein [Gemmatimonadaceae bacterium]|nr:TolC family protein [Gemmatimonadaceae bacterium]
MKLLVMALALPAALAAQTPSDTTARPIPLDEAVALAQRNAPSNVEALGQLQTSRAQVRAAYGAFIPSLTLSASSTRLGGAGATSQRVDPTTGALITVGSPWRFGNGLSLDLDLFDGGARINQLRASHAQVNAAVANDVSQRYATALLVKQQYYAVLASREADSAARTQLAEAQAQLQASTLKLHAGTATKSDSLRSVIQVGNAQLALVTAQNDLQTANATLTRLVGTPYTVTAAPEDTVGELLQPIDSAALARWAESGPAVRLAEANESAARADARAARGSYFPTLSAGFGLSGNGTSIDSYEYQNQFRVGLSWPVFNQFSRELQIARADVTEQNAQASLRDARLLAKQNLVQYLGAVRTAQQQVTIQSATVAAAEEDLRVQKQRYDLGASTLLDVLTSETALIQARAALIQARFNYRVAKAQLEALVGQPLGTTGAP